MAAAKKVTAKKPAGAFTKDSKKKIAQAKLKESIKKGNVQKNEVPFGPGGAAKAAVKIVKVVKDAKKAAAAKAAAKKLADKNSITGAKSTRKYQSMLDERLDNKFWSDLGKPKVPGVKPIKINPPKPR